MIFLTCWDGKGKQGNSASQPGPVSHKASLQLNYSLISCSAMTCVISWRNLVHWSLNLAVTLCYFVSGSVWFVNILPTAIFCESQWIDMFHLYQLSVFSSQNPEVLCVLAAVKPSVQFKRLCFETKLKCFESPQNSWRHAYLYLGAGSSYKSTGCCMIAPKSCKMPNHTNTWGYQTAAIFLEISGKYPTTKETQPKDDA